MTKVTDVLATRTVVGVDTHKDRHVAVALGSLGQRLGEFIFASDAPEELLSWAKAFGGELSFGIEGTASYGMGLAKYLAFSGYQVVDINRPNRQVRRLKGKSDPIDAEMAARSVLSGTGGGTPKSHDGIVEAMRVIDVGHDALIKAKTQLVAVMKSLVVTAEPVLRASLEKLPNPKLVETCAKYRSTSTNGDDLLSSTKMSLRVLSRQVRNLDNQIEELDNRRRRLIGQCAPSLVGAFGVGFDTAANLLRVFGDNPERIRSESAFAAMCGVSPIPASSGKTQRMRLSRGGNRQANSALYIIALCRMGHHGPTKDYVQKRLAEGKTKKEIIRCLKRYIAREVYRLVMADRAAKPLQLVA